MAELIKSAKMAGAMHEADHAYSIRSTLVIASISYRCSIHSLLLICPVLLPITWICQSYFYFIISIVVF